MKTTVSLIAALGLALVARSQNTVDYVEPYKPFGASPAVKDTAKRPVDPTRTLLVPLITWAADGVTVNANGGLTPNPNSPFARALGVPVQLEVIDDFDTQVANYISGKSAFLRGTADMIALAAEALRQKDPGLEPVVFLQLSTSTGADGFVGIGLEKLEDLKGKTIVTQRNGPHLSLVGNMLKDAGLKPADVTLKYVREITAPPKRDAKAPAIDPANALRRDSSLAGAMLISPDILAVTAGGNVGTGLEGTVKGAKPVFTTRTANNIIFDVYAVRRDVLDRNLPLVEAFRTEHLRQQEIFLAELANVAKKGSADRRKLDDFKKTCRPLARIFLQDEGAVNDYIVWAGVDSQLAGNAGNTRFFDDQNPIGLRATTGRIQEFFTQLGLVKNAVAVASFTPVVEATAPPKLVTPAKSTFASAQDVRKAAESKGANVLYRYTFKFSATTSDIAWRDYPDVFQKINETVARYGGAIVQLRGHADNFFANFVAAKRQQGESTYQRKNKQTGQFDVLPLPKLEEIVNDANSLSYARAFAVKKAYAAYVRESLKLSPEELDLSRFDVKGLGINEPLIRNPSTADQRAENMRGEMLIIAAESELPAEFGAEDLK
jgi:hypothetical protein